MEHTGPCTDTRVTMWYVLSAALIERKYRTTRFTLSTKSMKDYFVVSSPELKLNKKFAMWD